MRPSRPVLAPAVVLVATAGFLATLVGTAQASARPVPAGTATYSPGPVDPFVPADAVRRHVSFTPAQVVDDSAAPDPASAGRPVAASRAADRTLLGSASISHDSSAERVAALQLRLRWVGVPKVPSTGTYDAATAAAVARFQAKHELPVTGRADARSVATLARVSHRGPELDPRCTAVAVAVCVDKTQKVLRYVVDGRAVRTLDANFGPEKGEQGFGRYSRTREGAFAVYRRSADHVSTGYGTPMRWSLFFDGAEAMHFSDYFRRGGYGIRSFGCVDIGDEAGARWVFEHSPVGTAFVVYR